MIEFTEEQYRVMADAMAAKANDPTASWVDVAKAGIAAVNTPTASFRSFWVKWNPGAIADDVLEREAKRRSYVLLNSWDHALAQKLKGFNPSLKVFAYKDASSTRDYDHNPDHRLLPTGVSYDYANQFAPSWFLRDSAGTRLKYSNYSGHWQMDVGNTDYQDAWVRNVVAMKTQWPVWDGILIDNLLWTPSTYHAGVVPGKYPTESAFQAAYTSFLGAVAPALRTVGLLALGNLSDARLGGDRWNRYMTYLDGGWDEWWLTFSDTNILPSYDQGWGRQVQEIESNEQAGKITLVQPHHTAGTEGNRAFTYALASYYMGVQRNTKAALSSIEKTDAYGNPSPWREEMSWDLGQPLSAMQEVLPFVFRRSFERGVVVVNTNGYNTARSGVSLGGTYISKWGTAVSAVTLSGCQGAIFRKQI